MTVAMSDRDYRVLAEAVGWIELHAGNDAPEYPQLANLSDVMNSITKCREADGSTHSRVSPVDTPILDLRPEIGLTDTYEVEEFSAERVNLRCRRCDHTWRLAAETSWRCPAESHHNKAAMAALTGYVADRSPNPT